MGIEIEVLRVFFRKYFSASDEFCRQLEECQNDEDIFKFFKSDEFSSLLFPIEKELRNEIENLKDKNEDLERENRKLKRRKDEVECDIEELRYSKFNPQTYWEEEKYQLFKNFQHKFTPEQFEKLMNQNYEKL